MNAKAWSKMKTTGGMFKGNNWTLSRSACVKHHPLAPPPYPVCGQDFFFFKNKLGLFERSCVLSWNRISKGRLLVSVCVLGAFISSLTPWVLTNQAALWLFLVGVIPNSVLFHEMLVVMNSNFSPLDTGSSNLSGVEKVSEMRSARQSEGKRDTRAS